MPKIPAKFEDWTPPWAEGEIDEDKVARLVYNLQLSEQTQTAELKTLRKSNEELEEANEVFKAASEESAKSHDDATTKAVAEARATLEKERDQERERADKAEKANDLLKIRIEVPEIEESDLERLKGKDYDELLEDAKAFAERFAPKTDEEQEGEGANSLGHRQPRPPRTPADPKLGQGPDTNVQKYLEQRANQSSWVS